MEIVQAIMTKNRSYKKATPITPVGIVVHSTGAVNSELRRYVDLPERLGKNQYGNHWNQATATKSMHAFIGRDKDNNVIVAQALPYSIACWGAGKGKNGSANYMPHAKIQFEVCEGKTTDREYYEKAIQCAVEYCAYLCQQFGWTEKNIISHKEAHNLGLASNHDDIDDYLEAFGDTMDGFRKRVSKLLGTNLDVEEPVEEVETDQSLIETGEVDFDMKTLKNGTTGYQVKVLQTLLNGLGFDCGIVDGVFGTKTKNAVKVFQKNKSLSVDGIVGAQTWARLLKG